MHFQQFSVITSYDIGPNLAPSSSSHESREQVFLFPVYYQPPHRCEAAGNKQGISLPRTPL